MTSADDEQTPATPGTESAAPAPRRAETDWERRRRLDAVFGDALPDVTSDEVDEPGRRTTPPAARGRRGESAGESAGDRWLREQVPPHHG